MSNNDDDDEFPRRPRQTRPQEAIPDYSLISRDEVERLLDRRLKEIERRFDDFARRYCTEKEILVLCNKVTAQRWRNVSFPVSADADNPGQPEERAKAMIDYLAEITESAADRKGKLGRTLVRIAAVLGSLGTFLAALLGGYTYLAHLK